MRGLSLALLLGAGAAQAQAQPQKPKPGAADLRPEAERRNQKGNQLYQQGRFEEALRVYQAAYDLLPEPRFLFNVGLAREKTFDYEGCVVAFREYLKQAGDAAKAVRTQAQERHDACLEKTEIPVRFTSAPTNAAVYLGEGDARVLKGRTPQDLALPPGTYLVTMELQGYVTRKDSVTVEPGKRPQVDFVLDKLSSLRIEVDPSGAKVRVDELPWEAAPVTRELMPGTHRVQVEKEGHDRYDHEVKVEPGREVSLVLSLRPLPRIRVLSLRTRESVTGARVRIDGKEDGPPPLRRQIGPGSHRLEVAAPGHFPLADDVTVPEDRDLTLLVHLEPVRSRRNKLVAAGLLGAAVVAAGVGGVYGIMSLRDQSSFESDPNPMLSDRGERRAERADLAFASSAVLAGSAVLFYWLTTPSKSNVEVVY